MQDGPSTICAALRIYRCQFVPALNVKVAVGAIAGEEYPKADKADDHFSESSGFTS